MPMKNVLENALKLLGNQFNARKQWLLEALETPSHDEVSNLRRELKLLTEQLARLSTYEYGFQNHYNCPHCWLRHGTKMPLRPIPGTPETDRFKCDNGEEFECNARS